MGAHTLLCRGTALRGCDDHLADPLQAVGTEQRPNHVLHLLALSAMGDQAALESVRGCGQDQALVDSHHGGAHRRGLWWSGLHHPHVVLAARVAVLLLGDGLLERHPRHCGRRLLHARAQCPSADVLRWHPLHVLSPGHHFRTGHSGDDSRQLAGALSGRHLLFVVAHVLSRHGHLPLSVAMALRLAAPSR